MITNIVSCRFFSAVLCICFSTLFLFFFCHCYLWNALVLFFTTRIYYNIKRRYTSPHTLRAAQIRISCLERSFFIIFFLIYFLGFFVKCLLISFNLLLYIRLWKCEKSSISNTIITNNLQ